MAELKAAPNCCEEASALSVKTYVPCNRPAVSIVRFERTGEGPYRMCHMCATHNVNNRGATLIGPYAPTAPAAPSADDLAAYAEDSTPSLAEKEDTLAAITRTARELREAQDDVARCGEELKKAQERVRVLEELTLSDLMDRAGQKKLTTVDGYELERGETLRASIPQANMPQAIMWLRGQGQDAIVKRKIDLEFGKGEDQKAAEALDAIIKAGFAPTDKQTVHPQTLGAVLRELVGNGVEVPMALLGAHVQGWVRMKPAKR